MTYLTIDIGNTRMKYGVFSEGRLLVKGYASSIENIVREVNALTPSKAIVSAVRPLEKTETDLLNQLGMHLILDHNTPLPIRLNYETPETLGTDRICVSVAAHKMFQGETSLAIDAGTCITFDVVAADGTYGGGHISPGVGMRLNAMHHFTASLPSLSWKEDVSVIGRSTASCMRSGALNGACFEMDGFIRWYEEEFGRLNVIITGGDGDFFVRNLKRKIFVHPDLTLLGLVEILKHNDRKSD